MGSCEDRQSHFSHNLLPQQKTWQQGQPTVGLAGPTQLRPWPCLIGIPKVLGASVPCTSQQQNICFQDIPQHLSPFHTGRVDVSLGIGFSSQSRGGGPLRAVLVQRALGNKGFSITMGNPSPHRMQGSFYKRICYKYFLKKMSQ